MFITTSATTIADNGNQYRAVATNSAGTVTINAANVSHISVICGITR